MLPTLWPRQTIGRSPTRPCSLPKAIMLPANEMLPISAEMMIATDSLRIMRPGAPAFSWNSTSATRATAPPPTPLKSATICGIAVIFTLRAPTQPTVLPMMAPAAMIA